MGFAGFGASWGITTGIMIFGGGGTAEFGIARK
jgi:hypothetical protein